MSQGTAQFPQLHNFWFSKIFSLTPSSLRMKLRARRFFGEKKRLCDVHHLYLI